MTLQAHEPTSPRGTGAARPPAGWYPDPTGHARLRSWNGLTWSDWVSDGGTVRPDRIPRHRPLVRSDLRHLDFVEDVFLADAQARGLVTAQEEARLEGLLRSLRDLALTEGRAQAHDLPAPSPVDTRSRMPSASLPLAPATSAPLTHATSAPLTPVAPATATWPLAAPPPAPAPIGPPRATPPFETAPRPRPASALARWIARTREAVGSDLALHGLAYLGVLLFFVGAFGLVVFAFGDVAPTLRPVAELVIALAPFAAAAVLLHRGATVVGRALEVAGGLLVPVMLITGFLDDCPFPPDLYGIPLATTLTVLISVVAGAYAAWSWRHPESGLRYLVAPVVWLAVGMATLGLGERVVPDGKAVATPGAAQVTAILAALVVTVALARWRPGHLLARPTRLAGMPGLVVVGSMALLSWAAEGWPVGPVLLTGVLAVAALELLADDLPVAVVGLVEPLGWMLVWGAMALGAGAVPMPGAAVAALAAAGFLGILELAGAARRPTLFLALPALGLAAALVGTLADAGWATGAFAAAAVWTVARRTRPFPVPGAAGSLDVAAALLPALALANLAVATDLPTAVTTGALVTLAATAPARWDLLRRTPEDRYWVAWWAGAGATVLAVALGTWLQALEIEGESGWSFVATFAVLALSAALGPLPAQWRAPVVTAVTTLAWLAAAAHVDLSTLAVTGPLALAGLALVVVAHRPAVEHAAPGSPPARSTTPASVGLTGHGLGLAAIVLATGPGWAPVLATSLAAAGWGVTGWFDSLDRSPVATALARPLHVLRWMPLWLTAIGIPLSSALLLDRLAVLPLDHPWRVAVPAVTAVAYAVAARLPLPDHVQSVAARAGFAAALVAALAADTRMAAAVGLLTVPLVVIVLPRARRAAVMTWAAWVAVAPAAGLLAAEAFPWVGSLPPERATTYTLAAVGAALLVGAAAADLRGRAWVPTLLPHHDWALAPAVVGVAELATAVLLSITQLTGDLSGPVVAGAASAVLAVALLSRVGARAGVAVVLGWIAALQVWGSTIESHPWIAVGATLVLLAVAEATRVASKAHPWWARWDTAVLLSSAPVALTALVAAAPGPSAAATSAAVGAECLLVAGRLWRHRMVSVPLGVVGTALVVAGSATAGSGWLALALAALAVGLTALAVPATGLARVLLQVGGAASALGAWRAATDYWQVGDQRAVEAAAVWAALLALAAAAAARTRLARPWVLVWGGLAVTVEAAAALAALTPLAVSRADVAPAWPIAAALAVMAGCLVWAAGSLSLAWLLDLAVGAGLAAAAVGLAVSDVGDTTRVALLCAVTLASAGGTLLTARSASPQRGLRALVELGAASTAWALALALSPTPDAAFLVPVLATAAVQAAAVGVALRLPLLEMASPVLACAAWLVFSGQALDGNPQWVTVPIGLATLVVVALWRQARREHGGDVAAPEVVVLELVGIAFLVGAALVQAVTDSVGYAALAAALGLAVAAWGVVTKVRRRVVAGCGILLVGLVLLVGVPLWNQLLPTWDTASVWVLIGITGLLALGVAALLDWGRAAARRQLTRLEESTAGWE